MTKQVVHGASENPDLIRSRHGKPQAVSVLPLAVTDSLANVESVPSLLAARLGRDCGRELSDEGPCLMIRCFDGLARPFDERALTAVTFLDHVPDEGPGTASTTGNGFGFPLDQNRDVRVFL